MGGVFWPIWAYPIGFFRRTRQTGHSGERNAACGSCSHAQDSIHETANPFLDELRELTRRPVRAVLCAGSAGLTLLADGRWLTSLPLDLLDRLPGTPLRALPLSFGRAPTGYWSARVWERQEREMQRRWCAKVRVVGPQAYKIYFNDYIASPPPRREILRRTFDTWGKEPQDSIARLKVGIVGLGSVGCVVAEAIARIGVAQVTLIDPDKVEEHNLDRLLYASTRDIGRLKVKLARRAMRRNAAAERIQITALPLSVHEESAYKAAIDCDILFSCVDRPVARDVLNYIANAHMIPVIDGGILVETDRKRDRLFSAHWRAHIVTPFHQCLRCNGQYNSSMVVMELDGSLDDPSYISNLPPEERVGNQNVFPFSLGVAGMQVNLMLRYILTAEWWPLVRQQDYQFVTAETRIINNECHPHCSFRLRRARGDSENPAYLKETSHVRRWRAIWRRIVMAFCSQYQKS